ncbi:pentapeptide repeat-containing protein [Arthrobacter sp. STN4]|uniref:pentapeptide repeat-containing protein n=1 Tax=Arthrobacter sp. STN4 TaxID=2923276 RepID=UPI00211A432F|nr:pentapeptide repeat-containing protein [Arthrobacter sp. STN4]MCQ9163586.1 pentapeptide repeat-containing protein [Arthrobacter sp. STN4]
MRGDDDDLASLDDMRSLRGRWSMREGLVLSKEVLAWLRGGRRPSGLTEHEGRIDLRGLAAEPPALTGRVGTGETAFGVLAGVEHIRANWERLDLSGAVLPSLRFSGTSITDCIFRKTSCPDMRLWDCTVRDSSFEGADLRGSALGTWHDHKANCWINVSFDAADLRDALFYGGEIRCCSFRGSKLARAQFLQATIEKTVIASDLREVMFDGRELSDKPTAGPLRDVDFSGAAFADTEFRGYRFERVQLPPGARPIPNYPVVARRALDLVADNASKEARMLTGELRNALKMLGTRDATGVFNRADYVVAGGEALADLAESVLRRAEGTPA